MRRITNMILLTLLSLCLLGCESTKDKTTGEVKEAKTADIIKQIGLKELKEMVNGKEEFLVMITRTTCEYCDVMKRTLRPYFREHEDVPFYEVELDMLGDKVKDTQKSYEEVKKLLPDFSGATPEYLYYKGGSMKKKATGEMSEIAWSNL